MNYQDLIVWQYQKKPKAYATMKLLSDTFKDDIRCLLDFPRILDIATAKGKNLDLVGRHVGVSRVVSNYVYRQHFGFTKGEENLGFSLNNVGGGRFYRYGNPIFNVTYLEDEDYRWLIYSKIIRNTQKGTLTNVYKACLFLYGEDVEITDNGDMTTSVFIPEDLATDFTKWAVENLDILPRQCGVKYNFIFYKRNKKFFGFSKSSQSLAFNDGKFFIKSTEINPPEIEKGDGRNHVLNSDITTSSVRQTLSFSDEFKANSQGKWITLSCDINFFPVGDSKDPNRIGIEMAIAYEDGEIQGVICGLQDTDKVTEAVNKRFINTVKIKDKPIRRIYGCWLRNQTANSNATIGRPKIEYGQVATEWSKAPEDLK